MHKGEKQPLCNRATIRAKVSAHQPSGFSAFSASNYLGDLIFRDPTAIWLPINPLCQSFLIFNLLTVMLQCIIYFAVTSHSNVGEHGSQIFTGMVSTFRLSSCYKMTSYLLQSNGLVEVCKLNYIQNSVIHSSSATSSYEGSGGCCSLSQLTLGGGR